MLGKPKRPRNAFNIFVSEHFQEAKGASIQVNEESQSHKSLSCALFQVKVKISTEIIAAIHFCSWPILVPGSAHTWLDFSIHVGSQTLHGIGVPPSRVLFQNFQQILRI